MQITENNAATTVGVDLETYSNLVAATGEFYEPFCTTSSSIIAASLTNLRLPSLLQFVIDALQLLNL